MNVKRISDMRGGKIARSLASAALGIVMICLARPSWSAGAPMAVAGSGNVQSEVNALRNEVNELKGEIAALQKQNVVKPAAGTAAPKTIGQTVSALQSDLGSVRQDLSDNLGVHIHGLLDGTYEYNFNQPDTTGNIKGGFSPVATGGRTNQLRVFDVDANGWSLQQFDLHIDRTSDGGVGFVTDLNFGQVANVLRGSTRYSNLNPGSVSNGIFDLTQAYATYTVPVGSGIHLSLGKYATLLGYEVIPTYNAINFNETRSFIFGFAIPFTHTGLRAQYAFNDKIAATIGVNNGWDDVSNNNDGQTVEAQLALTPTPNLAFTVTGIYGPEEVNRGSSKRWVIDPIVTWTTPIKGLQLVGQFVHGQESSPVSAYAATTSQGNSMNNFPPGPDGTVTITHGVQWQGASGYIVYDLNDNIELATRGEWFEDSDGARTGLRQTLGEITQTLTYKVPGVSGLTARLEYRHDMSSAKPFFTNDGFAPDGTPLHTVSGQDTITAAALYTF